MLLPLSVPTAFLAGILDDAVKSRRLRANPARGVENLPRKTSKRRVYLSADDIGRLAAESKHRVLVLVLALCGLRWGEAVALRVRDVQFLKRRITVRDNAVQLASDFEEGLTKSRKDRSVPVPQFVLDELSAQCRGKNMDDLVFGDGEHYLPRPKSDGGWFAAAGPRFRTSRRMICDTRVRRWPSRLVSTCWPWRGSGKRALTCAEVGGGGGI